MTFLRSPPLWGASIRLVIQFDKFSMWMGNMGNLVILVFGYEV